MGDEPAKTLNPTNAPSEAHHRGWIAGMALRLGTGQIIRNPYERSSQGWQEWETGFSLGLEG